MNADIRTQASFRGTTVEVRMHSDGVSLRK